MKYNGLHLECIKCGTYVKESSHQGAIEFLGP
jgi:hypothetical protein